MNNNKIYYVCKYTPIELLAAMGASCENLNGMPGNFELAEQMVHPNICGFGKAVLEAVMAVSYTHLDVYKRQATQSSLQPKQSAATLL